MPFGSAGPLKAEIPFHYYNQNPFKMSFNFYNSLENKAPDSGKLIYFQIQEEKIEKFLNQTGVFHANFQEYCKSKTNSIKTCCSEEITSNNTKIHLTLSCQLFQRRRKNNNKENTK